ncbi:MAG: adenylate/guanylate cyclase domain-containing protein [Actinobacteria bacterium]|nr:adenylate/guanylate cyclase domain-containing protein [Actinomycetota bacterium]
MLSVEQFVEAGLYDPAEHEGTDRLELLHWLDSLGFTIPELNAGACGHGLSSIAGDRRTVPGKMMSRSDAIEMSGLDADTFDDFVTGFGFAPIPGAPSGEIGFTEAEVEAICLVGSMSSMFSVAETMGFVRVLGSALGRIGEAAVSLFLTDVEDPHITAGDSEFSLAKKVYEAVGLLDGLGERLDPILRRQLMQAVVRTREAAVMERLRFRFAIGFVDLVGFTERSAEMSAQNLTTFIREFEGRAHDVMTDHGARVVKLIGDEVMFVATEPGAACRAAGALMEGFADEGEHVFPRAGIAYGNVLVRGGDYYGSVVNLASRLVDEAVPQEVLVTDDLAEAATGCNFVPAGRRVVKGFPEPIAVQSLAAPATNTPTSNA